MKKLNLDKIIIEAKNRRILFKAGKLDKDKYSEKEYESDGQLIEHFKKIQEL